MYVVITLPKIRGLPAFLRGYVLTFSRRSQYKIVHTNCDPIKHKSPKSPSCKIFSIAEDIALIFLRNHK